MAISPDYIVGLTDGEGCFEIPVSKATRTDLGFRIRPEFRLHIDQQDSNTLEKIHEFFGFGYVYPRRLRPKSKKYRGNQVEGFVVVSLEDLKKIRNFFETHPLSIKRKPFEIWSNSVDLAEAISKTPRNQKSKKKELLLKLARLREDLSKYQSKHRPKTYSFENLKEAVRGL